MNWPLLAGVAVGAVVAALLTRRALRLKPAAEAGRLWLQGKADDALHLLSLAAPTDAAALFVRACIALERGEPADAARLGALLQRAAPRAVEGPLLLALAARRQTRPEEAWMDAMLHAWRAAGSPTHSGGNDAQHPALLNLDGTWPLPPERLNALTGADELLVRHALELTSPAVVAPAVRESARPDATAAVLWVSAAVFTDKRLAAHHPADAATQAQRCLERIAALDPTDGYAAVGAVLLAGPPTQALTDEELQRLDAALARARFEFPMLAVGDATRSAFRPVDPSQAGRKAFEGGTGGWPPAIHMCLPKRVAASGATPAAIALLKRAGARLEAAPRAVERMIGLWLQEEAAKLAGDGAAESDVQMRRAALKKLLSRARAVIPLWPLPSYLNAHVELMLAEEVALFTRWTER